MSLADKIGPYNPFVNARRDPIMDDVMNDPDVMALSEQLARLEKEAYRARVEQKKNEVISDIRKRIAEFGATPCR